MEQDKKLQHILLDGSQKASVYFTEAVMKKVHHLSANPHQYQPLVNSKVRKAFMTAFAILVASILLLCLIIVSPDLSFAHPPVIQPFTAYVYNNSYYILAFIISFWIVFAGNAIVEKMFLSSRNHLS